MKKYLMGLLLTGLITQLTAQIRTISKQPAADKTISVKNLPGTAAYDFSNVKMCIDIKYTAGSLPPKPITGIPLPPKINADGSLAGTGSVQQPLSAQTAKMWMPGETVPVFLSPLNSTAFIRNKVQEFAHKWEQFANVRFQFVNDISAAKIKVSFENTRRSWSWIGRDILYNPFNYFTMNFGWFDSQTSDEEFRRVVEHEFGHALGFIHEHQSPVAGIPWDKEKVYAFFGGPPNNWSRSEIDFNIFSKYSKTSTNYSAYDPRSIMHYYFPPELTTDGSGGYSNNDFSSIDKSYAGIVYPFPPRPGNARGMLRTGDDCDMIDFTVEYNVVPSDKVEFVLELGQYNNRAMTWWKQIAVPRKNNAESVLWVQDNTKKAVVQVPAADIDKSKGIKFWKAKLLGVHTLLNYHWNVLPAIQGGCRMRLTWKNDSCS
ncbi:MAG: hypothetical protein GC171_12150 [Terrimonas sp.]|nr:hypothetical protein [Terrimonas sp.]